MTEPNENTAYKTTPSDTKHPTVIRTRRRRWPWVLLAVAVLLIIVVALAPTLVSSRAGAGWVSSRASDSVRGRIELGNLSVSWFSPVRAGDVRIYDVDGRETLHVENVRTEKGLLGTLTGYRHFKTVSIDSPSVVLYQTPRGTYSLMDALEPARPEPPARPDRPIDRPADRPAEPERLPVDFRGVIELNSGRVRIVQADGRELAIDTIDGRVAIDTLNRIGSTLSMSIRDVGGLALEANIDGLAPDGFIDPMKSQTAATLKAPEPLNVAPLARFAGAPDMRGTVALDAEASVAGGKADARLALKARGVGETGAANLRPLDLDLDATVSADADHMNADLTVDSEAVKTDANIAWRNYAAGAELPPADKLLALLLEGGELTLPDIQVTSNGRVDLVALGRTAPTLMNLREGIELTGGVATFELAGHGRPAVAGELPGLRGNVIVENVAAVRDGQPIALDPARLAFNADYNPARGLVLNTLALNATGAELTASGELQKLDGRLDANLETLHRQLADIIDFGDMTLAGRIHGNFGMSRPGDDAIDQRVNLTVENLRYSGGGEAKPIALDKIVLVQEGRLTMTGAGVERFDIRSANLNVADRLRATAAGYIRLAEALNAEEPAMRLTATVPPADLAKLRELGVMLGAGDVTPMTGTFELNTTAVRQKTDGPIAVDGTLALRNATFEGRALDGDIEGRWEQVVMDAVDEELRVKRIAITGPVAVHVDDLVLKIAGVFDVRGRYTIDANLATVRDLLRAVSPDSGLPQLAGHLRWNGEGVTRDGATHLDGAMNIDNLKIGSEQGRFEDDRVTLEHRVALRPEADSIGIDRFALESKPLKLTLAGTVASMSQTAQLDLTGRYEASWEALTDVLHQFSPKLRETVALKGPSASAIVIKGPANNPNVSPAFKDLTARLDAGWTSGTVYGMELGQAVIAPRMADGRLVIPMTEIPASGGTLRLVGVYDMTGETAVFRIAEPVKMIDKVNVTPEMGRALLSHFNPFFGSMLDADGKVDLDIAALSMPTGEEMATLASGRGSIDIDMALRPSGHLAALLSAIGGGAADGGAERRVRVRIDKHPFNIDRGAVVYDNLKFAVGDGIDLMFSGRVGFDDSVALDMSVPMNEQLLTRFGVSERRLQSELLEVLKGQRITIPVRGTRQEPRLAWDEVEYAAMIRDATQEAIRRRAGDTIRDIFRPRDPQPQQPQEQPEGQPEPEPGEPGTPPRRPGIFDGILR